MEKLNFCMISWSLMIVGAINWGLVGLLGLDLVAAILGGVPILARVVYIMIGLSGCYALYGMITKKGCDSKKTAE